MRITGTRTSHTGYLGVETALIFVIIMSPVRRDAAYIEVNDLVAIGDFAVSNMPTAAGQDKGSSLPWNQLAAVKVTGGHREHETMVLLSLNSPTMSHIMRHDRLKVGSDDDCPPPHPTSLINGES